MRHPRHLRQGGLVAAALAWVLSGSTAASAQTTQQVLITGSIVESTVADAPYAISVVDRDALRAAGPQINLSEALSRVPGLVVANRSNYAQDLQISSRGFGARAGFGVRGIRLLSDGIPATGPDGQGQVAQFDLAGAERVEVLRGPFSVLYGNSSGGVISLISAPVREAEAEGEFDIGSFGLQQLRGSVAAPLGHGLDLRVSAAEMSIDGFRPNSEAHRHLANARLGWKSGNETVTVLASYYSQPAQDPLGLTRTLYDADPLQTAPQATQFATRKASAQEQLGTTWKHRFDDSALRDLQLMAYLGRRGVTQFLAIPPSTQGNPNHGGGVVDFDRDFAGAELRLRWAWTNIDLLAGASIDDQRDGRRGFENFVGSGATQVLGVEGKLRRDETDRARSRDVFAQGEWMVGAGLATSLGLRSGRVRLSAADHYLSNGDNSGALDFSYTNPVFGLRWQLAPGLQLHASVARGYESPTLGEVAYRLDGAGGLNTDLKAQTSRQAEVGAKWRSGSVDIDVALFDTRTADEIGVASNTGGRSAFQNVGHTLRRGAEFSGGWQFTPEWRTRLALTYLDATYRDPFVTCAATPCNPTASPPAGTGIALPGNRIAGTQKNSAFAELAWAGGAWGDWGVEARGAARTPVNDLNSDDAAGYGLLALRVGRTFSSTGSGQRVELLARVDNVFDRRYAGSVIVNEGNSRFFETGAPRNFMLAVRFIGSL